MTTSTRFRTRPLAVLLVLLPVLGLGAGGSASAFTATPAGSQLSQPASVARQAAVTRHSWNPNVRCRATVTNLSYVLGDERNKYGGATYRDGGFKPGIPDRRDFTPPCYRHGVPTFVQLNRVKMGSCSQINEDGDWTCELTDPTVRRGRPLVMSQIHVETDQKFRKAGGWSIPAGGVLIDVQGFVFWDPGHTETSWHHYSGWEIHSLTAWRRSPKR